VALVLQDRPVSREGADEVKRIPNNLREEAGLSANGDREYDEYDGRSPKGQRAYDEYNEYNDSIELPAPTEFPVDYMPAACRPLIREGSEAIGCPPEFVALPMLSALGSAIGNSRIVELKPGWTEKAVIFSVVIGTPGSKKSPAAKVAYKPVKDRQRILRNRYREEREKYAREYREYEKDKRLCRKDDVTEPRPPEEPVMERTVVDDTTVEALGRIQRDSARGVLVAKDELAGWLRAMDQYKAGGKGSDRQVWLALWNSDPIIIDRKSDPEPIMVQDPFIAISGGIQPEVLHDLSKGPEDGMLDRFVCGYPDSVAPGWRDGVITESAQRRYSDLYQQLRVRRMESDEYGDPLPQKVEFSSSAKAVLEQAINDHAAESNRPGFPSRLQGVYGKLEAYIGRLSLVLAMARSVEERSSEQVQPQDVVAACALVGYFKSMARRVYAAIREANPTDNLAEDLARFLESEGGEWKGEPSELYLQLKSAYKPPRVNEFSKRLKAVEKRWPSIGVSVGDSEMYHKPDGKRSSRRVITVKLL
jgi:putative DNA primase/helicase